MHIQASLRVRVQKHTFSLLPTCPLQLPSESLENGFRLLEGPTDQGTRKPGRNAIKQRRHSCPACGEAQSGQRGNSVVMGGHIGCTVSNLPPARATTAPQRSEDSHLSAVTSSSRNHNKLSDDITGAAYPSTQGYL